MKKPETRDRFRITCETRDAEQLGPIVAELARLGLNNVSYELITDVLRYKKNKKAKVKAKPKAKAHKKHAVSSIDTAVNFARKRQGKFTLAQIRDHFEKNGRVKSTANPVCSTLVKRGIAKRVAAGEYQLTAAAANGAAQPLHSVALEQTKRKQLNGKS